METKTILEQYKEVSCSCVDCQGSCYVSPCIPSPEEVLNLMNLGYGKRLSVGFYTDQVRNCIQIFIYPIAIPHPHPLINPCNFLDQKSGMCTLHDKGLKPLEGRIEGCHIGDHSKHVQLRSDICELWRSPLGIELIGKITDNHPTAIKMATERIMNDQIADLINKYNEAVDEGEVKSLTIDLSWMNNE